MAVFLIDAQLPPMLTANLRGAGHEALHVAELGLQDASDLQIAEKAKDIGAILVSKDEDFATFSTLGKIACPVLWIRFGNTTNAALWHRLTPLLPSLIEAFASGEMLIEVS